MKGDKINNNMGSMRRSMTNAARITKHPAAIQPHTGSQVVTFGLTFI